MDNDVTQHFRDSEKDTIDEFTSKILEAENQNRPILTNFLNPREQYILQTLVNRYQNLKVSFNGGFKEAEKQRGLIYPDYFEPESQDFMVRVLDIDYPSKFAELEHRQILGSFANSGINIDTFGDIVHDDLRWQIAINQELENFFIQEVNKIGKIKIKLKLAANNDYLPIQNDYERFFDTISSLRIDVLIANAFGVSRQHVKNLIERKFVTLNWATVQKNDEIVSINDVISVRKYGRIKLVDVLGKSKKDKLKVQLDIIKNKK